MELWLRRCSIAPILRVQRISSPSRSCEAVRPNGLDLA